MLRLHSNRMQNEPNLTVSKRIFYLLCSQVPVDNEVIALIFAVKKFHQYIYGLHWPLDPTGFVWWEQINPSLKEPLPVSSGGP